MWLQLNTMDELPREGLFVDKKGHYLIGYVFEDSTSKTGYIATSEDGSEIECVAYQPIKTKYNSVYEDIPTDRQVVCVDQAGNAIIGKLIEDEYGNVSAENESEIRYNICGWYDLETYQPAIANRRILAYARRFAMLVAAAILAIVTSCLTSKNVNTASVSSAYTFPSDLKPITEDVLKLSLKEPNAENTDDLLEKYLIEDTVSLVEISSNDTKYCEPFQSNALYLDDDGNVHYKDSHYFTYIVTEECMYIIDPSGTAYNEFDDYSFCFLEKGTPTCLQQYANKKNLQLVVYVDDDLFVEDFDLNFWEFKPGKTIYVSSKSGRTYCFDHNCLTISTEEGSVEYSNYSVILHGDNCNKMLYNRIGA